jgi:hypothetical protein
MARPKKLHARITEVGCMMARMWTEAVISPSALRLTPNFCSAQFAGSLTSGVPLDQVALLLGHSTKITEKQVEPVASRQPHRASHGEQGGYAFHGRHISCPASVISLFDRRGMVLHMHGPIVFVVLHRGIRSVERAYRKTARACHAVAGCARFCLLCMAAVVHCAADSGKDRKPRSASPYGYVVRHSRGGNSRARVSDNHCDGAPRL